MAMALGAICNDGLPPSGHLVTLDCLLYGTVMRNMVEHVWGRTIRNGAAALAAAGLLALVACASVPSNDQMEQPAVTPVAESNQLGQSVAVPAELIRQPQSSAPTRYVVEKGDTLWDISSRFLMSPWLWPEIWLANPQIRNPHLIYPGDIISLEWINGRPVLSIQRAGQPAAPARGTVTRLQPIVRSTPLEQAVPALPMDAIASFIASARFLDEAAASSAPYLLAAADGHLMAAKGMDVFARRFTDFNSSNWQILRPGQHYYDPETGERLGREAAAVGTVELLQAGDPARLHIDSSLREAKAGDLLFPIPENDYLPELRLQPVGENVEARVVAGFDEITRAGQFQIVVLNCGLNHDLKPGATFEAYAPPVAIEDSFSAEPETVLLPGEYRGLAVVFAVDEKVAHALVMDAEQAFRVGDYLRSPLVSKR